LPYNPAVTTAPLPSDISIRHAVAADAPTIVEFNQRLAWESEGKRLEHLTLRHGVERLLADASLGRYFVACRGDEMLGQVMLTYEWSDWRNGQIWWIQSVYVPAEHRRLGVFRRLYQHVRDLARREAVGLRLYVEHGNDVARRVYQSVGMHNSGYLVLEEMFAQQLDDHDTAADAS
jgi:GNAT superfamily N-acetyltransferase